MSAVKAVEPITCRETLERMKSHLRGRSERDYLIFRLGINLGFSIQQLLALKVEQIRGATEMSIGENSIEICESLQKELEAYLGDRTEGLLFPSRLGKPLTRHQVYIILKRTADHVDLGQSVGVTTIRKTFAYWAYRQGTSLQTLRQYLNQSSVRKTREYIAVEEEPSSSFPAISL